jgi:L-galactose dehydrogenase
MTEMCYKPLGQTGLEVSVLGFGTGPLGDEYGRLDVSEAYRAVHYAIERGINFFDSSPYYGRTLSETRLGEALAGGYREKIILATKAGRYDKPLETGFDFSYQRILASAEESLTRLQTDYLDLFQLHDIEFRPKAQILNEAIPALHKLKQDGKVRFIGVTGYPLHLLREIIEVADLDTVLSYCHYNLLNTTLDEVLTPTALEKDIGLINASALHMGVLTEKGAPAWHPAPQRVHSVAQQAASYCRSQGIDLTTLALQFALQHAYVASTLVGISTVPEAEQNLEVVGTRPDPAVLTGVQKIMAPVFNLNWQEGLPENFEPGSMPKQS